MTLSNWKLMLELIGIDEKMLFDGIKVLAQSKLQSYDAILLNSKNQRLKIA